MTQRKTLTQMLGTAALAGSLTAGALAQDSEEKTWLDERVSDIRHILEEATLEERAALTSEGLYTQTMINYSGEDFSFKSILHQQPSDRNDYGLRLDAKNFGLEFNAIDADEDSFEGVFRMYSEDKGHMIGGFFDSLPGKDKAGLFARYTINEGLKFEATADTNGAMNAVIMPHWNGEHGKNGLCSALGLGVNDAQGFVGNFSLNTDGIWTAVSFGDRALDARLVIGQLSPRKTHYFSSVDNSGINELKAIGDNTFQFGIGQKPRFEFYDELAALGNEPGDVALYTRFIEDSKAWGNLAVRLGDIGPFGDAAIVGGAYRSLVPGNEYNGATLEGQFNPFDNDDMEFRIKGDFSEEDSVVGAYFSIKF